MLGSGDQRFSQGSGLQTRNHQDPEGSQGAFLNREVAAQWVCDKSPHGQS